MSLCRAVTTNNNKGHKRIHTQRTFKYSISCPLPFMIAGVTLFLSIRYVEPLFEMSLERERFYSLETNVNINMILMQWKGPFCCVHHNSHTQIIVVRNCQNMRWEKEDDTRQRTSGDSEISRLTEITNLRTTLSKRRYPTRPRMQANSLLSQLRKHSKKMSTMPPQIPLSHLSSLISLVC